MKWTDYFFTMILVVTIAAAFVVLIPAYTEYKNARSEAQSRQREVRRQELQAHQLRRQIQAMKSDPAAIERVAREKLGWCREDEKIYHFEAVEGPAD